MSKSAAAPKNAFQAIDPMGAGLTGHGWLGGDLMKGPTPPGIPDFTGAALATANANKYDQNTPFGNVTWSLRPGANPQNPQPGDYIQSTSLSPGQQGVYDQSVGNKLGSGLAAQGILKDLSGGQQGIQDALYNKETQYYDRQFGNSQAALESKLQNQGVTPGSQAWSGAMADFNQGKNSAYEAATNDAITGATAQRGSLVSQLSSLLSGSQPTIPTSASGGQGADLLGAMKDMYNAQLGNTNAASAQQGQNMQAITSMLPLLLALL